MFLYMTKRFCLGHPAFMICLNNQIALPFREVLNISLYLSYSLEPSFIYTNQNNKEIMYIFIVLLAMGRSSRENERQSGKCVCY